MVVSAVFLVNSFMSTGEETKATLAGIGLDPFSVLFLQTGEDVRDIGGVWVELGSVCLLSSTSLFHSLQVKMYEFGPGTSWTVSHATIVCV